MQRKARKLETHQRIVKTAAKRFRERGLDGISVADVMAESGGTVGGFYKHFESRNALVVEALAEAMADYDAFRGGTVPVSDFIASYLSAQHRDAPGAGCATGALLSDLARADMSARTLATDRFAEGLLLLQKFTPGSSAPDRRANAMLLMCAMMGTLSLSRAVADPALSTEILNTVRQKLQELVRP